MDTRLRSEMVFLSSSDRLKMDLFRIVIRSGLMGRSIAKLISMLLLMLLNGTMLVYLCACISCSIAGEIPYTKSISPRLTASR